MSRNIDPKCRICRREGTKLFLKGDRCYSEKCAMNRKPYPPGKNSIFSQRFSNYGQRLREKQKVKRIYGLNEAQLKNLLEKASQSKGDKGLKLLQLLEMRLDNVVFLLGLAPSRDAARQMVTHGNIDLNGEKMTIPSVALVVGDKVKVRNPSIQIISSAVHKAPSWLKKAAKGGEVVKEPSREMIDEGINENMIVEFYSR